MKNIQLTSVILSAIFLVTCEKEKLEKNEDIDITGQSGTLTDYDGNKYNWIGIGKQAWMKENLRVTHYADGTAIPHIESYTDWGKLGHDDKAYCWYDNQTDNRDMYGGLYTWAAAMNGTEPNGTYPSGLQGVCPVGWHLPSDQDWKELEMHLGMSLEEANNTGTRGIDEGGKLKESGTTHWVGGIGASNESHLTALPGGRRLNYGQFDGLGTHANFWTASRQSTPSIWHRGLYYGNEGVYRNTIYMDNGLSVRCVRD